LTLQSYWQEQTWRSRKLPDFLIVGAQKAGTTTLSYLLGQHPHVFMPYFKEAHFFNLSYRNGLKFYARHFPLSYKVRIKNVCVGEATPDYIFFPQCPALIKETLPTVKIIVLLRDPVSRAISHYKHNVQMRRESLDLADALSFEIMRIQPKLVNISESPIEVLKDYSNYSYFSKGLYADQLDRYFALFPKSNILLVDSRDLKTNMKKVYRQTLSFLGLDDASEIDFSTKNESKVKVDVPQKVKDILKKKYFEPNKRLAQKYGLDFNH